MTEILNPPQRARKFLLDPPSVKNENILTPSKQMYNFELFQRDILNPPQKTFDPTHLSTTPLLLG